MNRYPVQVYAHRDERLSRGLPLVKWLLLIPHYLILIGLWLAFAVLTLVAYVCVLITGRYPEAIFAFNVGVLRWTWRVNYYGYQALGTDRYPPFTLADVADYPARLHIDRPAAPPRWLPLVAWLLAIPHLLLLGALGGAATWQFGNGDTAASVPLGVMDVGIAIAILALLFTGRYPRGLYHLLLGVARWSIRVVAYLALLTTEYPPFRLDQGEREPDGDPSDPSLRPYPTEDASGPLSEPKASPVAPSLDAAAVRYPAAPADRPAGGSVAGPVIALVTGVFLGLTGAGMGIGGTALLAMTGNRDTAGYVASPAAWVDSPTAAITAEDITLHAGDLWTRNLTDVGGIRITATSRTGAPLFLGIAPQSAVDDWLAGTAHDQLTTLTSEGARYERARGAVHQATAPAGQSFWLATASGTGTVVLNWRATNGDFALVLANSDGTPAVAARVQAAAQIPDLTGLGAGLLTAGTVLGLIAVALIIIGGVALGRLHSGPPTSTDQPTEGTPDPEPPSGTVTPPGPLADGLREPVSH